MSKTVAETVLNDVTQRRPVSTEQARYGLAEVAELREKLAAYEAAPALDVANYNAMSDAALKLSARNSELEICNEVMSAQVDKLTADLRLARRQYDATFERVDILETALTERGVTQLKCSCDKDATCQVCNGDGVLQL